MASHDVDFERNWLYDLFCVYFNKSTSDYMLCGRIWSLAVFQRQNVKLVTHVFLWVHWDWSGGKMEVLFLQLAQDFIYTTYNLLSLESKRKELSIEFLNIHLYTFTVP